MIGLLSNVLLLFGIFFIYFFLYSLSKQRNSLSAPFSIMCLAIAIYIIGYSFELRSDTLEEIIFFQKIEYFGIPFMSALWVVFSYRFYFKKKPSLNITLLIMIIPVLTLFFSVTNEYHHLLYSNVSTFTYNGYVLALMTKGPWYFVNVVYGYLSQLFGIFVFFSAWRKSGFRTGTQVFGMFFGSFSPILVNIIYMSGLSPFNLDLTPFGLILMGLFFYISLFRYDFLQVNEIVKDITFSEISEGILVIDEKNRLIDFNKAAKKLFNCLDVNHIGKDLSLFQEVGDILKQKNDRFEIEMANHCYSFHKTMIHEKNKNVGFVYFIQDISNQKVLNQALHDMANYDSLTQIYNRRKLMEDTEKELHRSSRYGHSISILMFDIDHFKRVNDKYGHLAGDEVLKELAKAVQNMIRITDIFGRYGGEEFIIFLPDTSYDGAYHVAEKIRNCIANMEFHYQNEIIHITISIGINTITLTGEQNDTIEHIINHADTALYQAKHNGRNQTCMYENFDVVHS